MKLRIGRRPIATMLPLSGRYLTRLFMLAGCCVFAMAALALPGWRATSAARSASGLPGDASVETAAAPSPFGVLGMDVIVSDDRPKPQDGPPDGATAAADRTKHELPPVDLRLLANVLDKTEQLYHRPYYHLVTLAAQAAPDLLESHARRDLSFADLWNDPENNRGEIVYVSGYIRGLEPIKPTDDEFLNPAKVQTLYQGHLLTTDSQPNPYVIIVPRVPDGMPVGSNILENVTFAGYFFKLWRYKAGDRTERAAPVLIGQMLTWTPTPAHDRDSRMSAYLAGGFLVLVICLGGAVWSLNRRSRLAASFGTALDPSPEAARSDLAELEKLDIPDPIEQLKNEQTT